jgi:hypothetical protein
VFLFVISGGAVLLENGFHLFSFIVKRGASAITAAEVATMAWQVVWALLLVPFIVILLALSRRIFLGFMARRFARGAGQYR